MNTASNINSTDSIGQTRPVGRRRTMALVAGIAVGSIGVIAGVGAGSASAIVDGADASVSENPWQVALTSSDGEQFCGGSIVSDRVIVTAAHCTQGQAEGDIAIRAGATDLTSDDGQTRNVTTVIEHPKYVQGVGDIAMLVLDRPLDLGGNVQAIELASSADVSGADTARVTGWGVESETSEGTPSVLQSTDVPLVSDADCSLVDEGNDDELCAGGTGSDSCYGDSGGPLTVATDNGQALAGVVSWGEECGGESAGVYAEVPTFANWIAERIEDPDGPAGERLPAFEDDFDDGDFDDEDNFDDEGLNDEDNFDDEGFDDENFDDEDFDNGSELSQEFVDSVGGFDALDEMSDEEFWDAYEDHMDENVGTDAPDPDPGSDSPDLNGDGIVQWNELIDV
jgi:hypothetical protein